ncbi:RodZ domain-containing protein [Pseudoalteromonas xiamenensis]
MSEEENTQPQNTLGQTLAQARANRNISVDFIATQLKITPQQIERIEADDYLTLGPETFVRGYIKAYCRIVELNQDEVFALYVDHPVPEKSRRMKSFSRRTEKEANDSRLMWVSYAILALVIGSSIFWWWQTTSSSEITPPNNNTAQTIELTQAETNDSAPELEKLANKLENVEVETAESAPIVEPPVSDLSVDKAENNSKASDGLSTIVMNFREESWVEIFDATSERIAFGVKKAGYRMTVAGKAPFSVVLVKHHAVDVTLDGQPVDLSHLQKNRLAKFKLPLTE